ncbi:MAG: hypothetical protein IPP57_17610 [Candidatus Obscuribacter sp.]|jgi:hypothetical protein|nr:hypothetical protein [Candidatus Obscuribacter sp.]MBK9772603.1 hypothetical protein [Candidatus Obscuribacter sp.]
MSTEPNNLFDLSSASIRASVIDSLSIASPCPKLWSEMELTGSEAVRFCGDCKKNVYNVAQMSTSEAELLLQKGCAQKEAGIESSVCMQLYRRADGTVITDDCPVGLRRVRDAWYRAKQRGAAALALAFGGIAGCLGVRADEAKQVVSPAVPAGREHMLRGDVIGGEAVMRPTAATWEVMALKHPQINTLMNKFKAVAAQSKCTNSDRLAMCKLNFEMAKLADAKGVPMFAQARLLMAQTVAETMPGQKALLKQILLQRQINDTALGGIKKDEIAARLKALEGEAK